MLAYVSVFTVYTIYRHNRNLLNSFTYAHAHAHTHTQCGAVSFIENVRAKNLKIPEEEFNMKMGYVGGKTDVDLFLEEGVIEEEEDKERIMVLKVG